MRPAGQAGRTVPPEHGAPSPGSMPEPETENDSNINQPSAWEPF